MPKAIKGVHIDCDESIRALILKIDAVNHDFVIEDLDDRSLVVKETKLPELKRRLEEELKDTQDEPRDSGSERE